MKLMPRKRNMILNKQEFKNTFEDKYGDKATSALQTAVFIRIGYKRRKN